jgi:hypothetical protein
MLHKEYDRKGSVEKELLVVSLKGAWLQDELIGGKPPVVKQLMTLTSYGRNDRSLIPGRGKILLFVASTPALGPTQRPIQWVRATLPSAIKPGGAWNWPHNYLVPRLRTVELYTYTPPYILMA